MNIIIINPILFTAQNNIIPKVESIKDCMIYNIALGFKELGHTITLVSASDYRPINDENYDFEVVFLKSHFKFLFYPSVLPFQLGLVRYLFYKKRKVDFVISSEIFSFNSLFASMIIPHKTLIWHELAVHTKKFKSIPSYLWYNIIVMIFFRRIIVAARSENAKTFISKYIKNVSSDIVEHGVNLQHFCFTKYKKHQFVIVSQLIPRKNINSIIQKFKKFINIKRFSDFKLLIVGKGELESSLKEYVLKEKIQKNVIFVGFKKHIDLCDIVSESMALLINTRQDNNMVTIPEAIVSGTPIVTNLVPTNSTMINDNNLGIAKNDWNDEDLVEIADNNSFYVEQCEKYRNELSTLNTAQKLINCFFKE